MTFHDLYTFQEDLVDGLYGPILRCTDLQHDNRDVAVKIISLVHHRRQCQKDPPDDPLQEMHFVQQLQATRGHPNVLRYHRIMDENQGQILIFVMEFCGRGDLLHVMHQHTPNQRFEECHALALFQQVVAGVKFLHDNGIAHRDLSLENVLVNDENVCKVCDFGLSCSTNELCHDQVGKSYYMAPEMIAKKAYNGVQADIWSLGIIIFIMLTGSPLCALASENCRTIDVLQRHGVGKILQFWGLSQVMSTSTVALLNGMLQVAPTQRLSMEAILGHCAFRQV